MIPFINQCVFSGRLTKEPNLKEVGEDRKVTNTTIAVNNRKKVNGEWTDDPVFINLEAWGVGAEMLARVPKGAPVVVTGQLSVDKYEVDGEPRQNLRLLVTAVGGLDEKKKEGSTSTKRPSDDLDLDSPDF